MDLQLQRMLCDAAWDGDAKGVRALLAYPGIVPAAHHSTALMHAAHRGKTACVELLLPVSDPNARNAESLWRAACHGRAACVRRLASASDTSGWEAWHWQAVPPAMRVLLGKLGHTKN